MPAFPGHAGFYGYRPRRARRLRRGFGLAGGRAPSNGSAPLPLHPLPSSDAVAHPAARYFNVGPVQRDQVEAYAAAKHASIAQTETWLGPSLGYDPSVIGQAAE